MTETFGVRLAAAIEQRGRLCVGIDPHPQLLAAWGLTQDAAGLESFARGTVEALGDTVAIFKPQSAFFEAFGSAGIAVLERVLADIRAAGSLSLLDAKRGDIGSTMAGYARAYLDDSSPLAADALTVSPFLGFGSLGPAIEVARDTGKGLYVLCRTSNPEGGQVQLATSDGRSVAQLMVDECQAANDGADPGSFGLVIGGTLTELGLDLSGFTGSILVPGIGAQGGTVDSLAALLGPAYPRVLPAASREVLSAGPNPDALRAAAVRLGATAR
ncbi:orotidine-5'-phosphate decarboxylase [Enemella evansiae]|uniref:Orotidine 5'-phosphate decarboxylase n=1 Tax=Enemella evansiae TaxID=2016499 RepID=A0A255G447_9ACTN|nr:orotidine-5'-phosphate decarboxylase [Enemella evansiae]OYO10699.1 orotidine-5'-phosphate decarboxylase [Enemella evansiae]